MSVNVSFGNWSDDLRRQHEAALRAKLQTKFGYLEVMMTQIKLADNGQVTIINSDPELEQRMADFLDDTGRDPLGRPIQL